MHNAQYTTHNKRHQLHAIYLLLVEFLHDIDHDAAEGETEMEKNLPRLSCSISKCHCSFDSVSRAPIIILLNKQKITFVRERIKHLPNDIINKQLLPNMLNIEMNFQCEQALMSQ